MKRYTACLSVLLGITVASLSGCGGGGGAGDGGGSSIPAAPTISAAPGNGQASLSWSAVANASSYSVYSSATSPVTVASAKTKVGTAGSTLAGLANGTPIYAAVAAEGPGGESALSNEVCAVPTAASTAGLALHDPLCASTLDGAKWLTPLFSRGVVNGAMELSAQASNMEANASRGLVYFSSVALNAAGQRVTTLQATITVPGTSASRTGAAEISADLRLAYQPPARRLTFPGANLDLLAVRVGLRDDGNGLRAFREVFHCDNASCTARTSSGVAFTDPAGFGGSAAASYDTPYVVSAGLNESTGLFTWTITGPGLNASGTADPAAYLAGNASWAAMGANPLANLGFFSANPSVRMVDHSGGSSGRITARFDDVRAGFNNAAAAPWDDFSAAGGNSGPAELSAAKWTGNPGRNSMNLAGGSLVGHAQATTASTASLSVFHSIGFSDPTAINTIQADFSISACSNSLSGTMRVGMTSTLYNDGTPGTISPDINQPNSRVGDITASLFLDCTLGDVRFQITRFDTNGTQTLLSSSGNAVIPKGAAAVVGNTHTLTMKWDPATRLLTLQADGQAPVVVDPTTVNTRMSIGAPFVRAANAPAKSLNWFLFFPSAASAGATASVNFKANNVLTAP